MRFEDYTLDQQKAITSCGTNILVSAGAGSGKTQVLTERVLYFIKNKDYKIDEFLILTFTDLASAEMKNRIRETLTKEHLTAANEVDFADICTFDSYALSLVKKYHFLLKVSQNVAIVDSNIISVRKKTLIEEMFEELYESKDETFLSMVKRFCFKNDNDLQALVFELYNKALLEIDTDKYLDDFTKRYYNQNALDTMLSLIEQSITPMKSKLQDLIEPLPEELLSKKNPIPYKVAMSNVFDAFFTAVKYDDLIATFPQDLSNIKSPSGLDDDYKDAIKKFKNAYEELKKYINGLPKNEAEFFKYFDEYVPYAECLIRIVKNLDQKIKAYKDEYQAYEFEDIAKKALNLLKENDDIRNSIKNKLKMIMIDEYQDTSLLQEAFISLISNNNVYMVGDIKQSIYRFRNARSDIFKDKYDAYKKGDGGIAIDLNKNFRSRKEVLDDINYIFKKIMLDECGGANYLKDHVIEFGQQTYQAFKDDRVSYNSDFLVYNYKTSADIATIEANIIARDIINKINNKYLVLGKENDKNVLRPCRFSDFTILMDRGSAFETYAQVFNEYQIPLFIESNENISKNDVVLILNNLLRLIKAIMNNDYSSDEFVKAFLSIARSFMYQYDDNKLYNLFQNRHFYDDEIIVELRNIINENAQLSIAELFKTILFSLNIYHRFIAVGDVKKNEKYLDMFLNMFETMSKLDYSLDDFIIFMKYIDSYDLNITLPSVGSSLDSVRIMNIHKSKGLEFPIVYFAGLQRQFNWMELKKDFGVSKQFGLILPPKKDMLNIVSKVNKDYEVCEDISEKIRLFYVMLTRTKEKMIFLYGSKLDPFTKEVAEYYAKKLNISTLDKAVGTQLVMNLFNEQKIDKFVLKLLLQMLDFDINNPSIELSEQESELLASLFSFDDIIVEKVNSVLNKVTCEKEQLMDCITLKDLLFDMKDYELFNRYYNDIEDEDLKLVLEEDKTIYKNLEIHEIKINKEEIKTFRASKELNLSANKKNMEFGSEIHFVMETMDFVNPDYSLIDNGFYKSVVKRFLSSSLMQNVKEGIVYKEYEFYDDVEAVNGIIDLMVVYDDHIDIIDYKTKNIDDESYVKQVQVYEKYVRRVFNKKVDTYLYALLTGECKKCN